MGSFFWKQFKRLLSSTTCSRSNRQNRHCRRSQGLPAAILERLETRTLLSANVLTFQDDNTRSGVNANETALSQANVAVGSFGKLYSTGLDGQVYAQPLIDTGVTISDGPNTTAGNSGLHDVAFVATENNSLYAIDAGVTVRFASAAAGITVAGTLIVSGSAAQPVVLDGLGVAAAAVSVVQGSATVSFATVRNFTRVSRLASRRC